MSRRAVIWAVALTVLGALFLFLTIHSRATWTGRSDPDQVLTLGQLMGFIVSGFMLLVAAMIVGTAVRRNRAAARGRAFRQRFHRP